MINKGLINYIQVKYIMYQKINCYNIYVYIHCSILFYKNKVFFLKFLFEKVRIDIIISYPSHLQDIFYDFKIDVNMKRIENSTSTYTQVNVYVTIVCCHYLNAKRNAYMYPNYKLSDCTKYKCNIKFKFLF